MKTLTVEAYTCACNKWYQQSCSASTGLTTRQADGHIMIGMCTNVQHAKHAKRGHQQQQKDVAETLIALITYLGCCTSRLLHNCPHILCALRVCFCEDCVCLHSVLLAEAQKGLARAPIWTEGYLQAKIRTGNKAHMPFSDGKRFLFINEDPSKFSTKDEVTIDLLSACI